MTSGCDLLWQDMPSFTRIGSHVRNALALWADKSMDARGVRINDDMLRVELAEPLLCYPLCFSLDGAVGQLSVGIECAALYPEYSAEVLRAMCEAEAARIDLVEWILMPWLGRLEARLGCALRIHAVALGKVMPADCIAVRLHAARGGHMHLAMSGSAMPFVADMIRAECRPVPWSWMRVPLVWVLRVLALSVAEMHALQVGAMLLLEQRALFFYFGHRQRRCLMTAQWNDENDTVVVGDSVQAGSGKINMSSDEQLLSLEELSFDIDVVLATHSLSIEQASALCSGSIMKLERPAEGRQVSLACDGRIFARGTLAKVDDRLAVLITECWGSRR